MNKAELVAKVAESANLSKADAARAVDAVTATITEALAAKDAVTLVGFGTFKSSPVSARVGRNPKTGQEIKIAARNRPVFTAGKSFKDALN